MYKRIPWFRWEFEDGYWVICKGFSAQEMKVEISKHGKCVNKVFECWDD